MILILFLLVLTLSDLGVYPPHQIRNPTTERLDRAVALKSMNPRTNMKHYFTKVPVGDVRLGPRPHLHTRVVGDHRRLVIDRDHSNVQPGGYRGL